ncbi:acyltransferase family protein [Kineococcus rhizosphaerae]|uniref:Putative membrane protein YcfT n=1 Tax=Kineococcus rhizosphaerae TaxID=559628 RepID=A0A2T0R4J6_9ACTN|nr:acyltransferase family protein [Kineococcus rhizosphaerae]PRY15283.1 putative membrane protein YcfT [Kineococcus rhizosphaerae]
MADDAVAERVEAPLTVAPAVVDRTRLSWPDAAKAVCILLVVVGHVSYLLIEVPDPRWFVHAGSPHVWNAVDVLLRPVRMPLFFAVSGFFAASALARPWAATLRPRVGQNLYLHVLWLLIGFGVSVAVGIDTYMAPPTARQLPEALLTASYGLWYLFALAFYFLLARLTRSWPAWVPVALAAVLAVVSFTGVLPGDKDGDTHSVLENLVWFLAGARFPDTVRRLSARRRPVLALGLGALLVVVLVGLRFVHPPTVVQAFLEIPTRAGAVVVGVLVAVLFTSRFPRLTEPLLRLGRRTLPVYAFHGILLMVLQRPLADVAEPLFSRLPKLAVWGVVLAYPIVLTAAFTWLCLAFQTLTRRLGAGFLFALPAPPARRTVRPGAAQ